MEITVVKNCLSNGVSSILDWILLCKCTSCRSRTSFENWPVVPDDVECPWPSCLVHQTQVLAASECGFQSQPGWSRRLCPWARHLTIIASSFEWDRKVPCTTNISARQRTHNDTYRARVWVYPGVSGSKLMALWKSSSGGWHGYHHYKKTLLEPGSKLSWIQFYSRFIRSSGYTITLMVPLGTYQAYDTAVSV